MGKAEKALGPPVAEWETLYLNKPLPLMEIFFFLSFPPTLSFSMELALSQAKKTCPFLHVTSTASLRRLAAQPATKQASVLLTKAQQCPVMSKAMAVRALSTSRSVAQKPTPSVKAMEKHDGAYRRPFPFFSESAVCVLI